MGGLGSGAARKHLDAFGHHERRIEADTEAADQSRLFFALRRFQTIDERLGAGAGNGAERLDHLVAAHADAVVLDHQLPLLGVDRERDARLCVIAKQRRRGDGFVAQPLASIGGVRDQLTQKHRFLGIDRVHHQLQELGDVGLERAAFRSVLLGHGLGHCLSHCLTHGGIPGALNDELFVRFCWCGDGERPPLGQDLAALDLGSAFADSGLRRGEHFRCLHMLGAHADSQQTAGYALQHRDHGEQPE